MERIADEAVVDPNRISFVVALRFIRDEWFWSRGARSPGAIPAHLRAMRAKIERFILPPRRSSRSYWPAVQIKMSGYLSTGALGKGADGSGGLNGIDVIDGTPPSVGGCQSPRRWPSLSERHWR